MKLATRLILILSAILSTALCRPPEPVYAARRYTHHSYSFDASATLLVPKVAVNVVVRCTGQGGSGAYALPGGGGGSGCWSETDMPTNGYPGIWALTIDGNSARVVAPRGSFICAAESGHDAFDINGGIGGTEFVGDFGNPGANGGQGGVFVLMGGGGASSGAPEGPGLPGGSADTSLLGGPGGVAVGSGGRGGMGSGFIFCDNGGSPGGGGGGRGDEYSLPGLGGLGLIVIEWDD